MASRFRIASVLDTVEAAIIAARLQISLGSFGHLALAFVRPVFYAWSFPTVLARLSRLGTVSYGRTMIFLNGKDPSLAASRRHLPADLGHEIPPEGRRRRRRRSHHRG